LKLVADAAGTLAQVIARRGGVSLSEARAAVERGGAFLRGKRERNVEAEVRPGDRIEVTLKAPDAIALGKDRVLLLDDLLLAVDKPAGVAAQEDLAGGPALPDLCRDLLASFGEKETQALLVHRLDRGTTGVTVLARTRRAQSALLEEFRERRVEKEYRALAAGAPGQDEGLVDDPVEGQPAVTRWRVLERFGDASSIAAFPETGRTHQIRLHLEAIGCPLLGDARYGGPMFLTRPDGSRIDFARPMLHAVSISLRHPSGKKTLTLRAPLPLDFDTARAFLMRSR
jgi:23S rRNA pseudouridine1911/1915/1917 synthase